MPATVAQAGHWKSPNSSSVTGALISPRTCSGFIVVDVALDGVLLLAAARFARYSIVPAPTATAATAAIIMKGRYRFMLEFAPASRTAQVKPGRRMAQRTGRETERQRVYAPAGECQIFCTFSP